VGRVHFLQQNLLQMVADPGDILLPIVLLVLAAPHSVLHLCTVDASCVQTSALVVWLH